MMSIIIDLIILLIIFIFAIVAYKKGFIASLLNFLGTIIAWIAAINLSKSLSFWIYQSFIKTPLTEYVFNQLTESANTTQEALISSIPEFITNAANAFGVDFNNIITTNSGQEIEMAANSITSNIIEPVITILVRIILVILLYLVFSLVIKLLSKLFKFINKIPLVGPLNKVLGIFVGLLKGTLISALICMIFSTILNLAGGQLFTITNETLNNTFIFKLLNSFNPLI